jgi:hypothetical protein
MSAPSRRRWFQFSLRGLLALMTVVAIGFGLWVSKLHRQQQALNSLRTKVDSWRHWVRFRDVPHARWLRQKWLTKLVGDNFFDEPVEIKLSSRVTDADAHALGQLSTLKRLSLDSTQVGDKGMPYLRTLRNLEHLNLFDSRAGDESLANMSGLAKLEELNLAYTPVTDAGLRHLAGLAKLRTLNLQATKVSDEGVAWLKDLDQLAVLDLSGTRVEGTTLRDLHGLKNMRELRLSHTKLTDHGLESLGQSQALESLWIDATSVTGSSFASIPYFAALKHLNLSGTAIGDEELQRLPAAPALRRLNLNDTAITDEGLKRLAQYQSLEALELRGTRITGRALTYLQTLPRLRYLNLCGTGIGDEDIESLNEICPLACVSLLGTKVTEGGLNRLQVAGSVANEPVDQRTMAHLAEPTEVDFANLPFTDAVDYLKQRHDQEILIDPRLPSAAPVTSNVRDVSLLEALEEMLAARGLVMVYRHSVLLITTRPVRPALCVPELAEGQDIARGLESVLSEKTELDFASEPLADIMAYLSTRHDIAIRVDEEAFRRADRASEVQLTWYIKGIPLRSALGLILEPLDMTCVVEDDALVIRPRPKSEPAEER